MKIQKRQEIEFFGTKTGNANSIALGYATETKNFGEVAVGVMNKSTAAKDPNSPKGVCVDSDATLFSVGCGGSGERKNALEVKGDGSVLISGEDGDINVADKIKQALDTNASIELVKSAESDLQYTLMVNNESRGSINIPKDQFLKNVTYDTEAKQLVFTFVTLDEEEHVERISINDLKDVYTAGDGINIDNNVISADFSSVMTAISDEKTQRETADNEIKSAKRVAVLTIAASDAPNYAKNNANFVCTGENDEQIINNAISMLPSKGGEIHLSAGLFNVSNPIIIDRRIKIEGEGQSIGGIPKYTQTNGIDYKKNIWGITVQNLYSNNGGGTIIRASSDCHVIQIGSVVKQKIQVTLRDFSIQGFGKDRHTKCGIYGKSSTDISLIDNISVTECFVGCYLHGDADNSYNDAIKIVNSSFQWCAIGLIVYGHYGNLTGCCIADNNGIVSYTDDDGNITNLNCGGVFLGGSDWVASNNTIVRCVSYNISESIAGDAVVLNGYNARITNNIFSQNAGSMIRLESDFIRIENNVFRNWAKSNISGNMAAIKQNLQWSNLCIIQNNEFKYPENPLSEEDYVINLTKGGIHVVKNNSFVSIGQNFTRYINAPNVIKSGNLAYGYTEENVIYKKVLDGNLETIDSTGNTVLYEDYNGTIKVGQDNIYDKPSIFVYEQWNEDTDAAASGVIINTNSVEVKDESANASLTIHHSGIVSMNGDSTHAYTTNGGIFDLDTKADTTAIPTKVSQLTNDSNFATENYVSDGIGAIKEYTIYNGNDNIQGLFNSNNEKIIVNGSKAIIIGFDDYEDSNASCINTVSIGNNITHQCRKSVCVGNEIDITGSNNIAIGRDIHSTTGNTVIIGKNLSCDTNGYIGIGWNIYSNTNAIYQIAGNENNSPYNLEETLTYSNQHKKYIYGIGGYDGTNSDAEGVKSLQEVLANKADASAYYTKTEIDGKGYLTAHQSLNAYAKKTELNKLNHDVSNTLVTTLINYARLEDIPNVSTKADLIDGKLKAEQLPKLDNIATATTTEDMITKFNALLTDLKAKGYMTADITA